MAKRLHIRDIKQFQGGIRKIHRNEYELKEGIIRLGEKDEDFYIEHAKKLYTDGVDRIILLSPERDKTKIENIAKTILEKSLNEWKRFPNDFLMEEDKYSFKDKIEIIADKIEIIDPEQRRNINIIQIDLVSNIYFFAKYYLSRINEHPEELPKQLARILAGVYPKKWKEEHPGKFPRYSPEDMLRIIIKLTSDQDLIDYFEFFHGFFAEEEWNIDEILKKVETLSRISTSIHAGINDLHQILGIIHKSLSLKSLAEICQLKNDIEIYFKTIPKPEAQTDRLFRKYLELFSFLERFQETSDLLDKLYYLEESRKKIRESEVLVENKFVDPFKKLYVNILKKWMDITFEEGKSLLGRASLRAKLQTKRTIWKEKLPVVLNIRNIGIGAAEKIEIVLDITPQYEVYGQNICVIDILQRNRNEDREFQIKPLTKENVTLHFSISYEGSNKTKFTDTLVFVEQEEFVKIPNPYNFTRPAEGDMFFGREDLFQWIEKNMKGSGIYQNVLINGERRIGKTSFLKKFQKRSSSDHHCVFIDLESYPNDDDLKFLYDVCQELHRIVPNEHSPPGLIEFTKKGYIALENYVQDLLSDIPDSKGIILIFDEFDKTEYMIREEKFKPGFLHYLRAFLQHNPRVTAIISGKFDFDQLNSLEWQEFFTILNPKKIGGLDEKSAEDIVTKPVKDFLQYDEYAIKKILGFSGKNPFYIQLLCHTLVNYMNDVKKQNFVEAEDVGPIVLNEAKEKADLILRMAWEELDQMDKNILFALSRLRLQSRGSVGLEELEQYLEQSEIKLKKWRLFNLLEPLAEKDILTKFEGSPPYYDFSVALLGEWITEHGSYG